VAAIEAGTTAIMPSHLRVPELTGDLPATVSSAALTGLLRGELGFTGLIVSDALEMRATRDIFGVPRSAVLAVAAGTDLLCLGRDSQEDEYLAVRDGAAPSEASSIVAEAEGILREAEGRSLVAVVRDAHRDPNTRSLVSALLAARPDTVLVEMGLPLWPPPGGTYYLATYGASRASAQAAAELLGLA
jgi:beta-N-acetylhexosaminidase